MKKKALGVILSIAMVAAALTGCGGGGATTGGGGTTAETGSTGGGAAGDLSDKKIAIVVKAAGNPYNERESKGFKEAIESLGATCIVKEPESASAEAQITMINELVSQKVDAIAIAGNDFNALQPALEQAMNAGIKVLSVDSSVNPDSRLVHVNQAGIDLIGTTLVDAVADIAGSEGGEFAILSATSQAANQNAWIEAMEAELEKDSRNLKLVKIAYGDDEFQKSVDETKALLKNYPNLKVICAPTTVGIMAAAKTIKESNSDVILTGLGLPSEMADYVGEDNVCPYMFLWNPIDIGRLAGYTAAALVKGEITGAEGDTYTAGDLGEYTIVKASDDGTEVILGPPFEFNAENIAEWADVY